MRVYGNFPRDPDGDAPVRPAGDYRRRFKQVPCPPAARHKNANHVVFLHAEPAFFLQSENAMNELNPKTTFRGLPLTPDQEREVEHYIHTHQRNGLAWDTPELQAMIDDMLNPPEMASDDETAVDLSMSAEQATALGEESGELDLLPHERERLRQREH